MAAPYIGPQSFPPDPATNDAPLEFNPNRNQPLVAPTMPAESQGTAPAEPTTSTPEPAAQAIATTTTTEETQREPVRDRSKERGSNYRRAPRRDTRPPPPRRPPQRPQDGRNGTRLQGQQTPEQIVSSTAASLLQYMAAANNPTAAAVARRGTSGLLPTPMDPQWQQAFTMMAAGDPSIYNMMGVTNYGQFGLVGADGMMGTPASMGMMIPPPAQPVKEVLRFTNCVLYPPKPNAPVRTTQERPPGCRTVFVGGLPENCTEEIMVEIFQRCGEIQTIRMNKKNFCHIRFMDCSYIDNAIFLSGYRMVVNGDQEASGNTGWLHVDYAQARDDQYEWECQQRALERELRHRERDVMRPPSPPPVPHYSDYEASSLIERLRGEENFPKAVSILVTWLERGECSKKNAPHFYSMIQSTNCNVRRLMSDKVRFEQELTQAKLLLKQRLSDIISQFSQIEKVFAASAHQKVWDHFTKAQRKNIDLWKKQAQEIKNAQMEEILNEREEDEMDVSDQEDWGPSPGKKARVDSYKSSSGMATGESILREENDALRCQLEAYRNEVEVLKAEMKSEQSSANRQQIQHLQQQLLSLSQQRAKDNQLIDQLQATVKVLQERKKKQPPKVAEVDKKEEEEAEKEADKEKEAEKEEIEEEASRGSSCGKDLEEATSPLNMEISSTSVPGKDALLIGIISTFLNVHPKGATVDYLWSYLQQLDPLILHRDIEAVLAAYPSVFSQEMLGVGASLERRWTFNGFKPPTL